MEKLFNFFTGIQSYVLAAFVGLSIVLGTMLYISNTKLDAETAGRRADRATYVAAQAQAEAAARKNKAETEKKYAEQAKKADDDYGALYDKYRAAVVRYEATKRQAGGANLPSPSEPSGGDNERDKDTLVPVPRSDLLICAENTARLEQVQEWAKNLQK